MTERERGFAVLRIILRHRSDNPVKGETIAELAQSSPREVATIVAECTKEGFALCSGAYGYFMAATQEEWEGHLDKERHRAVEILRKVQASRKNHINQITLFEQKVA